MKGPRLIVRALIVDDGRLLVNRHEDRLALFGGRVEKGERARPALARELGEELGLRVEVGPLAYLIENFFVDERERRVHEVGLYYRTRPLDPLGARPQPREPELSPSWLPLSGIAASALVPRALRDHLALGLPEQGTVELVEIDRLAFSKML